MNKKLLRSEMILHDDTNSTLANGYLPAVPFL